MSNVFMQFLNRSTLLAPIQTGAAEGLWPVLSNRAKPSSFVTSPS
jgi:hypothetical protein